jgi:hypothetical protein
MSLAGAFARTSAVRGPAALRPVAADKIKWWAKKKANDGEVSRVQSKILRKQSATTALLIQSLTINLSSVLLSDQIIRHVSANNVHFMGPWLKTFPKKVRVETSRYAFGILLIFPCFSLDIPYCFQVVERAPTYIMWPGGCAVVTYGIIAWAASTSKAEAVAHRY